MSSLGGGWFDAMGGGWLDAMGGGWTDTGGSAPAGRVFAMRADRPLAETPVPLNPNPTFPVSFWDSDLFALTFLPDFLSAQVNGQTWNQAITVGNPPLVIQSGPGAGDRIDELLELAVTERPEALGEILNQHQNQQLCFLQLLMIDRNSHPRTYFALKLAARVGEVVMMRLKRHFNRARPSQYCATLYPPVPVPGHASYPAGHALIAHLTARVLTQITTKGSASPYEDALTLLAERIGRNRVIAGLHFFSDIDAGAEAAEKTHGFLKGMPGSANPTPPVFTYKSVIDAAKKEWP
jgi:PAP2 superfamily protein